MTKTTTKGQKLQIETTTDNGEIMVDAKLDGKYIGSGNATIKQITSGTWPAGVTKAVRIILAGSQKHADLGLTDDEAQELQEEINAAQAEFAARPGQVSPEPVAYTPAEVAGTAVSQPRPAWYSRRNGPGRDEIDNQ